MSQLRPSNPLALPLVIVSAVSVAEAVGLIVLVVALARRPQPAPTPSVAQAPVASTPQAPPATTASAKQPPAQPANQTSTAGQRTSVAGSPQDGTVERGFALGKKGQPVESAGFAITVQQINYEPAYKNLANWGDDYRYLALLIVVDNNTGGNVTLFPAVFRLQDNQGYPYQQLGLKMASPTLPFTVLGNREKVRGYLDFVVPKTAKGLKLVYTGVPTNKSQPIHVELGE